MVAEPAGTVTVKLTLEDRDVLASLARQTGEDELADRLEAAEEDLRF